MNKKDIFQNISEIKFKTKFLTVSFLIKLSILKSYFGSTRFSNMNIHWSLDWNGENLNLPLLFIFI